MKTNQLNEAQRKTMNWRRLRGYGYGLGVRTVSYTHLDVYKRQRV